MAGKTGAVDSGAALCTAPVLSYLALLSSAGATLGERVLATLAAAPADEGFGSPDADAAQQGREGDVAIVDNELARLLAVRELFLAWMQELRTGEARGSTGLPAQFLRAWSESTGRVIQLLRARRDLTAGRGGDALLDAVYEDLERRLPVPEACLTGAATVPETGSVRDPGGVSQEEP